MTTETIERESMNTENTVTKLVDSVMEDINRIESVKVPMAEREEESNEFVLTPVERKTIKRERVERDGNVPWYSEILPKLRGQVFDVSTLYISIQRKYGDESISRMRVYNWLNQLVSRYTAIKIQRGPVDEYYVKTVEEEEMK